MYCPVGSSHDGTDQLKGRRICVNTQKPKNGRQAPKGRMSNPALPAEQTWKCVECGMLLAYLTKDREVVRVKYKDLFVEIGQANWVQIVCRRCAFINRADSDVG